MPTPTSSDARQDLPAREAGIGNGSGGGGGGDQGAPPALAARAPSAQWAQHVADALQAAVPDPDGPAVAITSPQWQLTGPLDSIVESSYRSPRFRESAIAAVRHLLDGRLKGGSLADYRAAYQALSLGFDGSAGRRRTPIDAFVRLTRLVMIGTDGADGTHGAEASRDAYRRGRAQALLDAFIEAWACGRIKT